MHVAAKLLLSQAPCTTRCILRLLRVLREIIDLYRHKLGRLNERIDVIINKYLRHQHLIRVLRGAHQVRQRNNTFKCNGLQDNIAVK
jgi:glyceraldehyde-3-phosphate dehydrogenase/erythrose-4-phosphate dehydrogenase